MFGGPAPRKSPVQRSAPSHLALRRENEERQRRQRQISTLAALMPVLSDDQNAHLGVEFDVTDPTSYAQDVQINTDAYGSKFVVNSDQLSDDQLHRINEVLDSTDPDTSTAEQGEWHVPVVDVFAKFQSWRRGGREEQHQQEESTEEFIRPKNGSATEYRARQQPRSSDAPAPPGPGSGLRFFGK